MKTRACVVNRIKELILQKHVTVSSLAQMSGLAPTTLKNVLSGVSRNPGIVTIKKICDGLDITLNDFFDTEEFRNLDQEIE